MNRARQRCHKLTKVLTALDSIAPLKYAEEAWDNVGLLYEHPFPHTASPFNIMLALDLTESVIEQAKSQECSMIVAYHPPWFKAVKRITQEPASEARLIGLCAALGMSVYSPHTAADNVDPGANDWVASRVLKAGNGVLGREVMQPSAVHGNNIGAGRLLAIRPTGFGEILQAVSQAFNLPTLRYALPPGASASSLMVSKVGICVGSGASLMHGHFNGPSESKMNLFLTGEMSHHDLLKAVNEYGCAVILTEHSTMERDYFFTRFRDQLERELSRSGDAFAVVAPEFDADPVRFFHRAQQ